MQARAAELINPGEYEFTTTTDGNARTLSHCVTPDDAKMANGDSKSGREAAERAAKGRCTIQSYDVAGNKVSFEMTCGDAVLASTTTYHGDTSEGDLVTTRTVNGVRSTAHTHTTARRLGNCK